MSAAMFPNMCEAQAPPFSTFSERLKTFQTWRGAQTPVSLAKAGFYRIPIGIDDVQCFYCGIKIFEWLPTDEPISEHVKWSPNCQFASVMNRIHSTRELLKDTLQVVEDLERSLNFEGEDVAGHGGDVAPPRTTTPPVAEHGAAGVRTVEDRQFIQLLKTLISEHV